MKTIAFGRFELPLGETPLIVGILNLTPDSFSDGGEYASFEAAALRWQAMVDEGAAVIDIGAESTRPGSIPISAEEEIRRLSAVKDLIAASSVPVSVDTYKSETAAAALNWGAQILNDVSGFQADPEMAAVAASAGCAVCLSGISRTDDNENDIMNAIKRSLERSLETAVRAGVKEDKIIIDPGIGFAMTPEQAFEAIRRLKELHTFRLPIELGTSRKRLFTSICGSVPRERAAATAVTTAVGVAAGVDFFRVHDVKDNREAALTAAAIFPDRRYPYE